MSRVVRLDKMGDDPEHWVIRLDDVEAMAFYGPDARDRAEQEASLLGARLDEDRPAAADTNAAEQLTADKALRGL